MISAIEKALDSWFLDKEISLIAIDSVGEKAFCAGGDIRFFHKAGCLLCTRPTRGTLPAALIFKKFHQIKCHSFWIILIRKDNHGMRSY